jgi:hypothetical protein
LVGGIEELKSVKVGKKSLAVEIRRLAKEIKSGLGGSLGVGNW